jgi:hypothetical protein
MWFLLWSFFKAPGTDGFRSSNQKKEMEKAENEDDELFVIDRDMLRINARLLDLINETITTCFMGL